MLPYIIVLCISRVFLEVTAPTEATDRATGRPWNGITVCLLSLLERQATPVTHPAKDNAALETSTAVGMICMKSVSSAAKARRHARVPCWDTVCIKEKDGCHQEGHRNGTLSLSLQQ